LNEISNCLGEQVRRALLEDSAWNDRTTETIVEGDIRGEAIITAKESGVISGQKCASEIFLQLDSRVEYNAVIGDGGRVKRGNEISRLEGPIAAILSGERTTLNFLQHLSGVATMTYLFVEVVAGTGVKILDTRKTIPGLRMLEKMAVTHGGGVNHRNTLKEMILVKENHIIVAGGMEAAISRMSDEELKTAEIEVSSLEQLRILSKAIPGRIMLDNFSPEDVKAAISELKSWGGDRPEIEVSGGITIDNIKSYARPGVDYISVGCLTSSAKALDMSLMVKE
jgi:nicotinate-nucleotide pyrophosphorylase (carboxylating)